MKKAKKTYYDFTWNPVTGCTPISEGCTNCYAERIAKRFNSACTDCNSAECEKCKNKMAHFKVTLHPERLEEPLRRKKPARIFVCSMSDLFHDDVPDDFIFKVSRTMAACPQHTFMILTKRAKRMKSLAENFMIIGGRKFSFSNVWLGVTAENQDRADERIPLLLQTPAAKRFVSIEPCLSAVEVFPYLGYNIQKRRNRNETTDGINSLQSCKTGNLDNRQKRKNLENEKWKKENSGTSYPARIHAIAKNDSGIQNRDGEPSDNLDSLQRDNSTRKNDKSQKRKEGRQPNRESGTCDIFRTGDTCLAYFKTRTYRSTRREKLHVKINGDGSKRNYDAERPDCFRNENETRTPNKTAGEKIQSELSGDLGSGEGISLDFCIIGGETGPGARECREKWVKSVYDQCQAADVPFFFKQEGAQWKPSCICDCTKCEEKTKCTDGIEIWKKRREWPK